MNLKKGQIVEFDIHALAFGGAGIGKYEGLTVFVEKTIPGDRIKASFTKIKSNYAEASLVEIIQPSKDRCKPRCPYFGFSFTNKIQCAGCNFQYMPYENQLKFKRQHVIDAFERIGKIYNPPVAEVLGAKEQYYYRNKMEFSFGYDENMNFALGMHVQNRKYDILDLKECYLQSEFSVEIVNKIREFALKKGWKPYKFTSNEGILKALFIREGKRTNEVMVNIVCSENPPSDEDLEDFVNEILALNNQKNSENKKIVSIYLSKVINKRGSPKQIKEILLYGKKTITENLILENKDELVFEILPQAFFQVNTFQAEVLYSQVMKLVENQDYETVFDLFCGTGTIGLFLAKHCEHVIGIEINAEAVKSAQQNAQKNKIFNMDFYTGDVLKILRNIKERPSLIVVDPPRAGLTSKIIKLINDFGSSKLIYVSCNPSTLARDCGWLKEYGYIVKSIQPVDMFPHTFHIENVCLLER